MTQCGSSENFLAEEVALPLACAALGFAVSRAAQRANGGRFLFLSALSDEVREDNDLQDPASPAAPVSSTPPGGWRTPAAYPAAQSLMSPMAPTATSLQCMSPVAQGSCSKWAVVRRVMRAPHGVTQPSSKFQSFGSQQSFVRNY
eukprot:gnl/MRDRNA2_/MRDRNA2_195249_c0_seq1.p1 gnl/MRDRNA2_/MRDRNA2_195249_c0~~gnl/MRDRNA2_/MRDRNA2_195249_c0_seq1.p1  ORF type:complete len:145 (+),score=27.32 gnl/MRDRNA2_/MRDRNA2_195249_c0_seq1:117-551(+)